MQNGIREEEDKQDMERHGENSLGCRAMVPDGQSVKKQKFIYMQCTVSN
jgi:hypothetical protein